MLKEERCLCRVCFNSALPLGRNGDARLQSTLQHFVCHLMDCPQLTGCSWGGFSHTVEMQNGAVLLWVQLGELW